MFRGNMLIISLEPEGTFEYTGEL